MSRISLKSRTSEIGGFGLGVGLDGLWRSLPTQTVLWFHECGGRQGWARSSGAAFGSGMANTAAVLAFAAACRLGYCRLWTLPCLPNLSFSFALPLLIYIFLFGFVFQTLLLGVSCVSTSSPQSAMVKHSDSLQDSLPKIVWEGLVWALWHPCWRRWSSPAPSLQQKFSRTPGIQGGEMKTEKGGEFSFYWVNL